MKLDLATTTRDSIEKDWLKRWNKRLGNPDRTPRQVMRTYVEDLDITVAHLDEEMDWDCWDFDAFDTRRWRMSDMIRSLLMRQLGPYPVGTPGLCTQCPHLRHTSILTHHLNPHLSHPL